MLITGHNVTGLSGHCTFDNPVVVRVCRNRINPLSGSCKNNNSQQPANEAVNFFTRKIEFRILGDPIKLAQDFGGKTKLQFGL
jgi:hypothetical protein